MRSSGSLHFSPIPKRLNYYLFGVMNAPSVWFCAQLLFPTGKRHFSHFVYLDTFHNAFVLILQDIRRQFTSSAFKLFMAPFQAFQLHHSVVSL
jgi:hypothetical protein